MFFINLHTTASLIIPTDIKAAFASSMNAWMLASSSEHSGGTTGKESWSPVPLFPYTSWLTPFSHNYYHS